MDSLDHFSSAHTGNMIVDNFLVCNFLGLFSMGSIFELFVVRDEEKKMGTLVKEDFGRPDRSNTMVSNKFYCLIFTACVNIRFSS